MSEIAEDRKPEPSGAPADFTSPEKLYDDS